MKYGSYKMPLYKFVVDDGRLPVDDGTVELSDNVAAYFEAIRIAGKALTDNSARIARRGNWSVNVNDDCGNSIYNIAISANEVG